MSPAGPTIVGAKRKFLFFFSFSKSLENAFPKAWKVFYSK